MTFSAEAIRADFPILATSLRGKPLVYLDNGATTQKPQAVLDAVSRFYREDNANVHRAVHTLSARATAAYEKARRCVQEFVGAKNPNEVIFVRGATEGINLIASTFGQLRVHAGDEVVVTAMEHHSNIVPWQMLCERVGAKLVVWPITDAGELDLQARVLSPKTKLVCLTHVSNVLGTVNPVKTVVAKAKQYGAAVIVDGAQAAAHVPINVADLGCDFYVFSGHKVYAPTGIGAVWGKREHLEKMPPWQGGGDMILSVSFAKTTYADAPQKFEAGTPNVGGAVGLAAALTYLKNLGVDAVAEAEAKLLAYARERLQAVAGVKIVGSPNEQVAAIAFTMAGIHPHDLGTIVDQDGVAIRSGHHCAEPLHERLGLAATARISFGVYSTRADIDALISALGRARQIFDGAAR